MCIIMKRGVCHVCFSSRWVCFVQNLSSAASFSSSTLGHCWHCLCEKQKNKKNKQPFFLLFLAFNQTLSIFFFLKRNRMEKKENHRLFFFFTMKHATFLWYLLHDLKKKRIRFRGWFSFFSEIDVVLCWVSFFSLTCHAELSLPSNEFDFTLNAVFLFFLWQMWV